MDTIVARPARSLVRLALTGAGLAFAWILLTLALGIGAVHAQAEDGSDDERGVLGAVTELVDSTASTVTTTLDETASTVTKAVDTVVDVAPEPVKKPAKQAVEAVGTVVGAVTEPVAEIASDDIVTTVTTPIVKTAKKLPVVGEVVETLGVDDVLTDVSSTADDTLVDIIGTAETIGDPSLPDDAVSPPLPDLLAPPFTASPADAGTHAASVEISDAGDDALPSAVEARLVLPLMITRAAGFAAAAVSASTPVATAGSITAQPLHSSAAAPRPSTLSSSGSGGAGPGAWAMVALLPFVAHRAWVRRAGPEDDHAPPAPLFGTDVSPD